MPTRLLLDGEDLRSLMLRVREEMGPHARVVRAERVRTGGIAGFFAKERYELTVEVPDPGHAPTGLRPGVAATDVVGLDALLAAADAAERQDAGSPASVGPAAPTSPAAPTPTSTAGPTSPPTARAPAVPELSTTGESFAEVLDSVRRIVGPEGAEDGSPTPEPPVDAPSTTSEPSPEPPAAASSSPSEEPAAEPRSRSTVSALLELGIPTRMLEGFTDPAAVVPLSVLVRRFDPAPPVRLGPGSVVVVAGEPGLALRVATQMAHRAQVATRDVLLAGEMEPVPGHGRRLVTPVSAARARARVAPDRPTVVALGVGEDREAQEQGSLLLEALAPDQVWGVVDARRKAVDVRRWVRGLGVRRAVDALAVSSAFEAQSPGTVLQLGTPVGWLDGLPASPVVWAAVLSERLADDAHWD